MFYWFKICSVSIYYTDVYSFLFLQFDFLKLLISRPGRSARSSSTAARRSAPRTATAGRRCSGRRRSGRRLRRCAGSSARTARTPRDPAERVTTTRRNLGTESFKPHATAEKVVFLKEVGSRVGSSSGQSGRLLADVKRKERQFVFFLFVLLSYACSSGFPI